MEAFNLIIAGDTQFDDYQLLKTTVSELLMGKIRSFEIVIVSNAAKGAGLLGEKYAAEMGYEVAEFLSEGGHSHATIFSTNKKMVESADACICFSDGKSNYCRHLIGVVNLAGLPLTIINY